MALIRMIAAAAVVAALSGCAHEISLTGDASKIPALSTSPLDKTVGLVITDDQLSREVITPGGGGDKVSYRPYHDLELPIYVGLGHVFKNVTKLKSAPDAATIQAKHLDYVITPTIKTTSSSPSPFTWPPTDFSVTLACTVADPSGQTVVTADVTGTGHAEFSEFKRNFGLAGQLATADAVSKLQSALAKAPELQK
ncbi:hypothetical protein WT67_11170 [Burkholderia stagnalis]|uniref:Lipoprotein n=1 Tax=Burkholderia stagnalis TaxID=1503054 RepID=A0A108GVC9_9BURK|nr:hypothetical protein [Burkholderia stagnalis]AOK53420.1 hypothetical protein WT74_12375 [Burkholderia stagnalis]KAB0640738.1 hypothetical protein F7R25_04360 [Burkholderia stagnalis]KVL89559.1 hypothetical protein WT03_23160 [Burkholderia stagnalis]KVL98014.1 hypothetical protein WT02_12310 [Burkholderia stagnalis]KVM15822.1 hypothetical protein WT04_05610 [Burkholderia stagnalis]